MVSLTLDGSECVLDLPPDCLSVAQATSYAKSKLGASWADTCSPGSMRVSATACTFTDGILVNLEDVEQGRNRSSRKRLFLSVRGWQPGGTLAKDARLLGFGNTGYTPAADELPASLLRGGLLQLRAFTPERAQVTIELPEGGAASLPVTEATCGVDLVSRAAKLLGCAPERLRLWDDVDRLLPDADRVIPGARFRAKLFAADRRSGPEVQMFVNTLTGKMITVELTLDSTTDELKQAIQDQQGIPPDQQRIIFAGRQLEDGKTLESQRLSRECTVHLMLRLRGGMFALSSGRVGNFEELGLAADEREVADIATAGRTPVEIVLPDCSSVLLGCEEGDGPQEVLAALRERLAAAAGEEAVLDAQVDELEDVAAMRDLLRQAQAALRQRRRHA